METLLQILIGAYILITVYLLYITDKYNKELNDILKDSFEHNNQLMDTNLVLTLLLKHLNVFEPYNLEADYPKLLLDIDRYQEGEIIAESKYYTITKVNNNFMVFSDSELRSEIIEKVIVLEQNITP